MHDACDSSWILGDYRTSLKRWFGFPMFPRYVVILQQIVFTGTGVAQLGSCATAGTRLGSGVAFATRRRCAAGWFKSNVVLGNAGRVAAGVVFIFVLAILAIVSLFGAVWVLVQPTAVVIRIVPVITDDDGGCVAGVVLTLVVVLTIGLVLIRV